MLIDFKGKKLNTEDLRFLGDGLEGKVYAYNEYALKVYHEEAKKRFLTYEEVQPLLNINTSRILLPRENIYKLEEDIGYFGGYATELLDNEYDIKDIVNMSGSTISDEFDLLEEDKQTLNKNKLSYYDTNETANFIYDNGFYFVDPGSIIKEDLSEEDIDKLNDTVIGEGIYKNIIYLHGNIIALAKEFKITIITDIGTFRIMMTVTKDIYEKDFENNKEEYFKYIRQQLEHYGSLQKYKYELIKNNYQNYETEYPGAVAELKKVL